MRELALFAGAGGGILGGKLLGWQTVCAVEINEYCQRVLMQRQDDGILEPFPIWSDIRTFDGRPWRGLVDVVSGGVPCQPWSRSGDLLGENDERNLWPDTFRIIGEVGPRYVFLENVPGILDFQFFGNILGSLAEMGYRIRWSIIGAADVGAPHSRERIWIVADNAGGMRDSRDSMVSCPHWGSQIEYRRLLGAPMVVGRERRGIGFECEPRVERLVGRFPARMDRLKAAGNAQVPQVVRAAWEALAP